MESVGVYSNVVTQAVGILRDMLNGYTCNLPDKLGQCLLTGCANLLAGGGVDLSPGSMYHGRSLAWD